MWAHFVAKSLQFLVLSARVIDFVFLEFFIEIAIGCLIIVKLVKVTLFKIVEHPMQLFCLRKGGELLRRVTFD